MGELATCPACGCRFEGKRIIKTVDRQGALQSWDKLKEAQHDICWFLYRFKVGTKQELAEAFFFNRKEQKARWNIAKNNLNHLENVGLVIRFEGGNQQHHRAFYYLSDAGIYCCQAEEKKAGRNVKRIKALKAPQLIDSPRWKHTLAINNVMASFVAGEQQGFGFLQGYWGDGEKCYEFNSLGGRKKLFPDSTIIWAANKRVYYGWLELENRHASLDDLIEKIEKYIKFKRASNGNTFRISTGQYLFPVLMVVGVRRGQLPGLRQSVLSGILRGTNGAPIAITAKEIVVAVTCLDYVSEFGVFGEIWDAVIQGLGRCISFEELFNLCCI